MSDKRADLDPLTRAVSDTLDELLFRHHGITSSWSNPESFIKWLSENGYKIVPNDTRILVPADPSGFDW